MSLLITPITLTVISFLVKDKSISLVSRLLSLLLVINIIYHYTIGNDYFYLKEALFDVAMFSTVFLLRDNLRAMLVGLPCVISFILNIYEQFSYYQTPFYEYRDYLQFVFMQVIILGLIVNCEWRNTWKTNTQN